MKLSHAFKILRDAGPQWVAQRVALSLADRSGATKRKTPVKTWSDFSHEDEAPRVFSQLPAVASVPEEAEQVLKGEFTFFSAARFSLGVPPDWRLNPFNQQTARSNAHWTEIPWNAAGDIKCVWELSRFGWALPLMRAYAVAREDRYATAFWRLLEDWCENNPPNAGIQWKCGQETTIRMINALMAADAFREAPSSTLERIRFICAFVEAHAQRVEAHIEYALSQRNNHSISEAVGLFTAGSLFPKSEDAKRWREKGRVLLERLVREQIYDDGSYLQHSFNYQRFSLSILLWAIHVDDVAGNHLSKELRARTLKCAEMLASFVDAQSGAMPNTGGNDGAYLFALSSCAYADFRPIVQWAFRKLARARRYSSGPWDETADWFGAPAGEISPISAQSAPIGGYYRLQGKDSWGMLRCAHYKDRPFHADQLHLDIFYRGKPVILDAGTYAYNPQNADDGDNALTGTAVHNTVLLDGKDQMQRAGRFLWLDWAQAKVHSQDSSSVDAEHNGYAPVVHHRNVKVEGDRWLVTDHITSSGEHEIELHWLIGDGEWRLDGSALEVGNCRLRLESSANQSLRLIRGGERIAGMGSSSVDRYRGWYSPTYRVKQPAISLVCTIRAASPLRVTTEISFSE